MEGTHALVNLVTQMWDILILSRGGSRIAATSKMERFMQSLTIITKRSILDVAAVLDPSLL